MGKIVKKVAKVIKKAAPIALPLAALAVPGVGTAISGALGSLGGVGSALSTGASALSAINSAQGLLGGGQKSSSPTYIYNGAPSTTPPEVAEAPVFNPTKPGAVDLPSSLSDIAGYAPDQQRSALATKGLNQGLGGDEQSYYNNLIQRTLIGDDNKVTGSLDSLLPVEQQYFSQKGAPTGNINDFLKYLQG